MPCEQTICVNPCLQVLRRINQVPQETACMTDHPGFEPVCLNIYSLQNAMNIYRADHGPLRITGMERYEVSWKLVHIHYRY